MAKFDYSFRDERGYEGQTLSAHYDSVDSAMNKTGIADLDPDILAQGQTESYLHLLSIGIVLPYGRGVQAITPADATPATDQDYTLPYEYNLQNPIQGLAFLVHRWERPIDRTKPDGIPFNRQFGLYKRGEVLLWTEQPVKKYDPLFCRVELPTPNPDGLILGRWRKDDDDETAMPCPDCFFRESRTTPGLVPVWVDFMKARPTAFVPPAPAPAPPPPTP